MNLTEVVDDLLVGCYIANHGLPKTIYIDGDPGKELYVCEERVDDNGNFIYRELFSLSLADSRNPYIRIILSKLVEAYNDKVGTG